MNEMIKKAQNIEIVAFDVDGVLTDGSITYNEQGYESKTFNAKDGQGMVMLSKEGFITAIITARQSKIVDLRAKELGITHIYQGCKNKSVAIQELIEKYKVDYANIAYMGDDLPDIAVLEKVAIACCPSDAIDEVKSLCNFISKKEGGRGAVRELADFILRAKKHKDCQTLSGNAELPSFKK